MVVNNQNSTIAVRRGVGDGTFTTPTTSTFATSASPIDIALGYINGDTNLDALVVNNGSSDVNVFLGSGDGMFQKQTPATALKTRPRTARYGDSRTS